ncbi:MAG: tetratricopeptide repeat protein [Planctomycetota bacterium]|jgi:tetratricopeptide (TPR) repeat protein
MKRAIVVLAVLIIAAAPAWAQSSRELHRKASEHHRNKEYEEAIKIYEQIIEADPNDSIALYNAACGHSLLGNKEEAVDYLKKSVAAGYTNFNHMEADSDLDAIRDTDGYKELLAKRDELEKGAIEGRLERYKKELGEKYKVVRDEERKLVILSDMKEETLNQYLGILRRYQDALHSEYFEHLPDYYILVLIPSSAAEYRDKFGGRSGAAGFYNPGTRTLTVNIQTGTGTMTHEFTHAMHYADQGGHRQRHPIWIIEAFGSLFEQCTVRDGRPIGFTNWRLPILQRAIRGGNAFPMRDFITKSNRYFQRNSSLSYAQTRYIFYYLQEKGLLQDFYRAYTHFWNEDRAGLVVLEEVLGRSIEEWVPEWEKFVLGLRYSGGAPRSGGPRIGISIEAVEEGLKITTVSPGSGAEEAKLREGDVVTKADGADIRTIEDLRKVLGKKKKGDKLALTILRDGEEQEIEVKLK